MTTPAINTPNAIIVDALYDAGKLQEGTTPGSEQIATALRRLRDVINTAQLSGLKLWLNVDTAVPLTAGQAAYIFAPSGSVDMTKPLRVIQGYYLYTTGSIRRPITVLSWNDYLTLGQAGVAAANQGTINSYFVNKKATQLEVTFWLCPDTTEAANGQAHVLLQTQVTNPVNLTETMNFPEEWRMYLHWALAAELATGMPDAVIARCEGKATMYKELLEGWDVEDTPTQFQPDSRGQYSTSSFR